MDYIAILDKFGFPVLMSVGLLLILRVFVERVLIALLNMHAAERREWIQAWKDSNAKTDAVLASNADATLALTKAVAEMNGRRRQGDEDESGRARRGGPRET